MWNLEEKCFEKNYDVIFRAAEANVCLAPEVVAVVAEGRNQRLRKRDVE